MGAETPLCVNAMVDLLQSIGLLLLAITCLLQARTQRKLVALVENLLTAFEKGIVVAQATLALPPFQRAADDEDAPHKHDPTYYN